MLPSPRMRFLPFTMLEGHAASLPLADLGADRILPLRFLTSVERRGVGRWLFHDLRFDADGFPRPDFPLNAPRDPAPRILLTGENFGAGPVRAHAAWALADYGFAAVVAPSFGRRFPDLCAEAGVLTIALPADACALLAEQADAGPFQIDLEAQTVAPPMGARLYFEIAPRRKLKLQHGLDDLTLTLPREPDIAAFEARRRIPGAWAM